MHTIIAAVSNAWLTAQCLTTYLSWTGTSAWLWRLWNVQLGWRMMILCIRICNK